MAKRYKVGKKADVKHFRKTSMRTKAINRSVGNAQGGIRL